MLEDMRIIQERAAQILAEGLTDSALARRPAPLPDALIIAQSAQPPAELEQVIGEAIARGQWDAALRLETSAHLRATFELALCRAEASYQLPIPELARRMAEIQILSAEQADEETMAQAMAEAIHGAGVQLVMWGCEQGHAGRAPNLPAVASVGCPVCGAPIHRMTTN